MIFLDSWVPTHDNLENEIIQFHQISPFWGSFDDISAEMKQIETINHEKQLKSIDFDDFEYFSVSFAIFMSSIFRKLA